MPNKTNKKQVVKAKATKTTVKSKPSSAKTKTVKKSVKKPVVKKAAPKKLLKKPVAKAKTPAKQLKKPVVAAKKLKPAPKVAVKALKSIKPVVEKVAKAPKVKAPPKSRKKATKLDKKMARTLIKIANSQKTAVATVGVQSAAMNAVRATMVMAAANANLPQAQAAQTHAGNSYANQSKLALAAKPVDPAAAKAAFKPGDVVVYPAHGVGKVAAVEAHTIGGQEVKLFRITFDHERMTLKVPVARASGSGLRQLSSKETMKNVFETMKGRPRVRRVMWSRRAQEYEQKINSGDPVAIAEVLRDLRRNAESGDQSYSERQIFQNALERLSREVAAIEKIDQEKATQKLSDLLLRKLPAAANNDEVDAA